MKNAWIGLFQSLLFLAILFTACETTDDLSPNDPQVSCNDGIQNGDETGIDCGGPDCDPCQAAPTCSDGVQNGDETGVDCGGPDCDPCQAVPTCNDGIQNGNETGIDCGGPDCDPCQAAPTCSDGIQNGNETGIDCGGPDCDPCSSNLSMMDYISQMDQFSTLKAAIQRAGFEVEMDAAGPYTFFAPNNNAWAAFLSNNGWTSIEQVSPGVLNTVLKFHFSNQGAYTSDQFTNAFQIVILFQNKTIYIDMTDPNETRVIAGLTSAGIIGADQNTTNGVVHETDAVLSF